MGHAAAARQLALTLLTLGAMPPPERASDPCRMFALTTCSEGEKRRERRDRRWRERENRDGPHHTLAPEWAPSETRGATAD